MDLFSYVFLGGVTGLKSSCCGFTSDLLLDGVRASVNFSIAL